MPQNNKYVNQWEKLILDSSKDPEFVSIINEFNPKMSLVQTRYNSNTNHYLVLSHNSETGEYLHLVIENNVIIDASTILIKPSSIEMDIYEHKLNCAIDKKFTHFLDCFQNRYLRIGKYNLETVQLVKSNLPTLSECIPKESINNLCQETFMDSNLSANNEMSFVSTNTFNSEYEDHDTQLSQYNSFAYSENIPQEQENIPKVSIFQNQDIMKKPNQVRKLSDLLSTAHKPSNHKINI